MHYAPQIEPVTKMIRDHKKLLAQTTIGPVHLTQRGIETAVLISSHEWRKIVHGLKQLEDLRRQARLERVDKAYDEFLADPSQAVDQAEYEQMLAEAGLSE